MTWGIFLSGGIDSAAIAAVASSAAAPHTFTVVSPSTVENSDYRCAAHVARHLGLPNHQVLFADGDLAARWRPADWRRLLWLCETPLCGPEQLYKYELHRYARAARPRLKIILTGQGSPEFNGGYSTTFAPEADAGWEAFLPAVAGIAETDARWRPPVAIWDEHFAAPLLSRDYALEAAGSPPLRERDTYDLYVLAKHSDLQMYNCWHEDRTAAGNGIENRVPLLDHRLVELAVGPEDVPNA